MAVTVTAESPAALAVRVMYGDVVNPKRATIGFSMGRLSAMMALNATPEQAEGFAKDILAMVARVRAMQAAKAGGA